MSPATHAEYPGRVARPNSPMSPWQSKPSSSGPLPWLFPEVANLNSKTLGQLGGLAGGQEKHGYLYTQLQHQKWSILFCVTFHQLISHTLVQFLFVFLFKGLFPRGLKVAVVFTIVIWYIMALFRFLLQNFLQLTVLLQKYKWLLHNRKSNAPCFSPFWQHLQISHHCICNASQVKTHRFSSLVKVMACA